MRPEKFEIDQIREQFEYNPRAGVELINEEIKDLSEWKRLFNDSMDRSDRRFVSEYHQELLQLRDEFESAYRLQVLDEMQQQAEQAKASKGPGLLSTLCVLGIGISLFGDDD